MARDRNEFDRLDVTDIESLPRWLQDFIDLNNEFSGQNTGRTKRFFVTRDGDGPEAEKKKEERRFNALLRLLQDPAYAQLYQNAVRTVTRAEDAVERAMRKLSRESDTAAERVDALKRNAAELPDGRKVFRSKDGRLIAEDGKDVTDRKDSVKGITPGMASWEEFQRTRQTLEDIERRKREVEAYQRDVLEPARERLSDGDNPRTADELKEIVDTVDKYQPADVRAEAAKPDAPVAASTAKQDSAVDLDDLLGPIKLNAPDLRADFKAAQNDEPYGSSATPSPTKGPKSL